MNEKAPGLKSPDFEALLLRLQRLMKHVWKHFREDHLFEEAASLRDRIRELQKALVFEARIHTEAV